MEGHRLGDLIQCNICKKWFHEVCESVDRTNFEHPQSQCMVLYQMFFILIILSLLFNPVYAVCLYFLVSYIKNLSLLVFKLQVFIFFSCPFKFHMGLIFQLSFKFHGVHIFQLSFEK